MAINWKKDNYFQGSDSFWQTHHDNMVSVKSKNSHQHDVVLENQRASRRRQRSRRTDKSRGAPAAHNISRLHRFESNHNQPKPTDNEFLNPVGFGWFKSVLVGFGYQVPENAEKTASFCRSIMLIAQPKPTALASHYGSLPGYAGLYPVRPLLGCRALVEKLYRGKFPKPVKKR
jgi:hypothetical protein